MIVQCVELVVGITLFKKAVAYMCITTLLAFVPTILNL